MFVLFVQRERKTSHGRLKEVYPQTDVMEFPNSGCIRQVSQFEQNKCAETNLTESDRNNVLNILQIVDFHMAITKNQHD